MVGMVQWERKQCCWAGEVERRWSRTSAVRICVSRAHMNRACECHQVYDTTFDIRLTEDGKRWLDDFEVKGPSPQNNPTSWDRSPVANGAHYFLYGKINPQTPGELQESGFGVIFPNYIVDVKKDDNGEYQEAIQFQCLERGGLLAVLCLNGTQSEEGRSSPPHPPCLQPPTPGSDRKFLRGRS